LAWFSKNKWSNQNFWEMYIWLYFQHSYVSGDRYSFLVDSAYVPAYFQHDHQGAPRMGSDRVPRRPRDPRFPAAGRGGWCVTVDTATTGLDLAITVDPCGRWSDNGQQSDPSGRWSDNGQQWSDTGRRRSDTWCCRLVSGRHGDTVSRPPRTAGGQGTWPLDVRQGPDLGWR
jgi:hypothetical protein